MSIKRKWQEWKCCKRVMDLLRKCLPHHAYGNLVFPDRFASFLCVCPEIEAPLVQNWKALHREEQFAVIKFDKDYFRVVDDVFCRNLALWQPAVSVHGKSPEIKQGWAKQLGKSRICWNLTLRMKPSQRWSRTTRRNFSQSWSSILRMKSPPQWS